MRRPGLSIVFSSLLFAAVTFAQSISGAPSQATSADSSAPPTKSRPANAEKSSAGSKTVKAESVTINMPEGITRDQADEILSELKAIHQLLQVQGSKGSAPSSAAAPAASEKVHLKVASGWHWMGRDDAPVTIVEFTDYQCPFCRKYHTETFAKLKKDYIDSGKVRFVSRDLPLDFHPNAQRAAEAAWCAGEQNKYWELRDTMIINSSDLSKDAIGKYAQTNALDLASFQACADSDKYKAEIEKGIADAGTVGISGTPSFVIGKTSADAIDGDRVVGAVPESVFENEIQKFMPSRP
jgi:protein-disulfide isomerase